MFKSVLKILIILGFTAISACEEAFDYSPYVIDFEGENKGVNKRNIDKLKQYNNDSSLQIVFTGDTHRFYDELDDFVGAVNKLGDSRPIDFVVHVGDIADFGLPQQYLWGNSYLLKLNYPYMVALGNHDMVGNGGLAYTNMFGNYNFSFVYKNIKFIFVNTNSREFSFNGEVPNINWLSSELTPADNFTNAIVIIHVPPMDDDFDKSMEEDFHETIAKYNNVMLVVHGHKHHFEIYKPYSDSITYLNVYGVEYRKYNLLKISANSFEIDTYEF